MANSFYYNLYHNDLPDIPYVINQMFSPLSLDELNLIGCNVSPMKVRESLLSMYGLKAPKKDDIQAISYQNQWDRVGPDLCNLVEKIFMNPEEIGKVNETLISKVEPITSLTHMRPISLCNISYKVVTKDLARRLRRVMEKLVAPTQCNFVSGRQTSDNIIITQESYPLDEKDMLDEFSLSRGIQQGDPISPYIFVLCMELLSQLIGAVLKNNYWKPINLSKDGPQLSHLSFANDLILFSEASMEQAEIISMVLDAFCQSPGKKVNNEKTRIFFFTNVGNIVRYEISEALWFTHTDDLEKYLGIPLIHSKVSKEAYSGIINNLNSRLNGWKAATLLLAGRPTLLHEEGKIPTCEKEYAPLGMMWNTILFGTLMLAPKSDFGFTSVYLKLASLRILLPR
ncbi:uncharacterized protein LOC130946057 [Arachis stenosperma]|uniref:uncharacterized protein LOC130946057 n=1 Tax=Arachis stenosperma TaxID=217475 RepID=UPI0025AD7D5E|nr:uncharacterized protein LOC130946057 [Arachis stenosperma]